jgi:uncharacterized protein YbcI
LEQSRRGPEEEPLDPDPSPGQDVGPSSEAITDELRADILAIHRDSYGRGSEDVKVYLLDDTLIIILEGLELLPNEEFMIEQGHPEAVLELRAQFQQAIGPTFRAAAERATGRKVIGFASHTQLDDPRFAVEIFRLEPRR